MKKVIKSLIIIITILGFTYLIIDQSRSFYKLENDKEVTVWKRIGGKCYVIPYKYYGIIKPSGCYIETVNTSGFTLIWHQGKIVVNTDAKMKIIGNNNCNLQDYMDNKLENNSLYLWNDAGVFKLKSDLKYISIYILDNSVYYNR